MNIYINQVERQKPINEAIRTQIALLYYGFLIIILLLRASEGILLHQYQQPIVHDFAADIWFWLLLYLDIPAFFNQPNVSFIADISIFIGAVSLFILFAWKKNELARPLSFLFSVFFLLYTSVIDIWVETIDIHSGIALVAMGFVFFPKNIDWFLILSRFARYYFCFAFLSAGLWKLFRGNMFSADHAHYTFLTEHIGYMVSHPNGWLHDWINYFIQLPIWLHYSLYVAAIVLELIYIVGFFTYKYDKILLCLAILFLIVDFGVMALIFRDVTALTLPFLYAYRSYQTAP